MNATTDLRPALAYRPDIDGLRAIAIAAVVLFHAGIAGFGGGYVGVDVFFVISGYLITQFLDRSATRDGSAPRSLGARLREFYIRRCRRILPALLVMLIAAAIAAVVILLPADLVRFATYLTATPLFMTNITAWREGASYFDSATAPMTLSHLWSIAIEEQFYLLFPVTLFLVSRYGDRRRLAILGVLALASFAICVWGSHHRPFANYYMASSRAWELLLGATLASSEAIRVKRRISNELLAAGALGTLVWVIHRYSSVTTYPGWNALAPCVASGALIVAGRGPLNFTTRLLSLRPLVYIGLISYSLYLWHIPVLGFFEYAHIVRVSSAELAILLAVMSVLAVASWKLIERPVRSKRILRSDRALLWAALLLNVLVLGAGALLWVGNGLPQRFPEEVSVWGHAWYAGRRDVLRCLNLPPATVAAAALCSFGSQDAQALRVLVWGDSHALTQLPVYERLAVAHHVRLYFAIRYSCRPLLGLVNRPEGEAERLGCSQFNAAAVQAIRRLEPDLIILNAHWVDPDEDQDLIPGADNAMASAEPAFWRALAETLRQIDSNRRSICAVLDVPTFRYLVPYALGVARKRGLSEAFLRLDPEQVRQQDQVPRAVFKSFAGTARLRSVDPKEALCPGDDCLIEADGKLLYGDSNHLTLAGAERVVPIIDRCFSRFEPPALR